MPNLKIRSYEKELIDDLELDNDALRQNLEELAFINRWLGGDEVTLHGLNESGLQKTISEITIADLGCGGGDMLALMARWARKNKVKAQLVGIDANDFMTEFAKKRTADFPEISYLHENIFSESFKKLNFDVITMTLFCHHFEDETLTKLFQQFGQQAKKAIIINDLHRHWLAYYSIAWLTKLFSKSYLVKNDAKLSVWRGFSRKELQSIIEKAGFTNYTIKWRWAFRWQVVISC